MAVPTYATDLVDIDTAEATTNWTAIGTGAISAETDYFLQGSACISKVGWTAATRGMICNNGAGVTFASLAVFIAWVDYHNPNLLDTYAQGGIRLIIGSSTAAYYNWYVGGSDTVPFGGWHAFVVDPTVASDATTGAPTPTRQYFGALGKILGSGALKGNPFGVDVIRYGRELRITNGSTADGYATITGAETYANDATRRWGLLYLREGAYYQQGGLILGLAGTAVDFRDSDQTIFILHTPKAAAGFNEFEVRNASSRVDMTRFVVRALGSTSPGKFTVTDNATVNLTACSFIGMGTHTYKSNTTALGCVYNACGQISPTGGKVKNCTINGYTGASNTSALVWNEATDPNGYLDGTTYTKGAGTTHAIEFGTSSPTTMTLTGITFSGYNAVDGNNDSAIHVKRTSGTVTINITGGTTPSVKTEGATVVLVSGTVTVTVTVTTTAGTAISSAAVLVKATSGGPFPYDATVTIANSGTTATVTHSTHGMATNDKVFISGASHAANNGVFSITKIDANSYSYTMGSAPGSNPTGTIKCTFVVLSGTTDGSGQLTMSRVFPSNQPFAGWARKSSSAPYYKQGAIIGTVNSGTGASVSAVLVGDD